jgi:hypothetical protein
VFPGEFLEHFSPVAETKVVVEPMRVNELFLGLSCYHSSNHDGDWKRGQLMELRTPWGQDVVAVDRVDQQQFNGIIPGSIAREEVCSEGGSGITDIQILVTAALDNQLAREQVVRTCFVRVGDCTGMLGVTVQGFTKG